MFVYGGVYRENEESKGPRTLIRHMSSDMFCARGNFYRFSNVMVLHMRTCLKTSAFRYAAGLKVVMASETCHMASFFSQICSFAYSYMRNL